MSSLNLKIVTPEQTVFEGEVSQVNVPTRDGEIGILPNHANLMTRLSPGELSIKKSGKNEVLAIGDGFLQIDNNQATIMTDLAVNEDKIDEKALEDAKKRAETALEQKLSDEEYADTLAILEKTIAQLRVKRRHRIR